MKRLLCLIGLIALSLNASDIRVSEEDIEKISLKYHIGIKPDITKAGRFIVYEYPGDKEGIFVYANQLWDKLSDIAKEKIRRCQWEARLNNKQLDQSECLEKRFETRVKKQGVVDINKLMKDSGL